MRRLTTAVILSATLATVATTSAGATAPASKVASHTVANCSPKTMSVSLGQSQGAAGTMYHPVIFTNTGSRCQIFGIAAIQPVTATHQPVGPAALGPMGVMAALHTEDGPVSLRELRGD
jgi:hypothetical protein